MDITIDFEKLERLTDIDTINPVEILYIAKITLDYLASHNKNYTKKQYHFIDRIKGIVESINIYLN